LALLTACAPPPKVAGYTRAAAPPAPTSEPPAAPPPERAPTEVAPAAPLVSPPPPTPEAPRTAPSLPPSGNIAAAHELGIPGGFALEAMSPKGSYFAYCQPTGTSAQKPLDQPLNERGQAKSPVTLSLAIGTERFVLDELWANDPQGRFVVTLEGGAPFLHDAAEHRGFPLAALRVDLERDALPDHRAVAFAADGRELALVTQTAVGTFQLSVLDLTAPDPTATVRTVPLPDGRPWRVSAAGDTFVITTSTSSTALASSATSKGSHWPVRASTQRQLRCTRATFDAFPRVSGPARDPTLGYALLPRGATALQPAPGFVMAVGGGWMRREDDGRLLLVQGKQQRQLASARCGGRILGADATSGWFLVSCEEYRPVKRDEPKSKGSKKRPPPPKIRFPLYLLKPGVVRDLDVEIMRSGVDVPPRPEVRFLAVRSEAGLLLVDLGKGKTELLPTSDRVLLANETEVLLASSGRLVRSAGGQRQELGPLRDLDAIVTSAHGVSVGSSVYFRTGTTWQSSRVERPPLALGDEFALVPAREPTTARWANAPLKVVPIGRARTPTPPLGVAERRTDSGSSGGPPEQ